MKLPVTEMSSMEYSHSKNYKLKATVETKGFLFECFLVVSHNVRRFPVSCDLLLQTPPLYVPRLCNTLDALAPLSSHVEWDAHLQSNE